MSMYSLCLFKAAGHSLAPIQAQWGMPTLPVPDLTDHLEEILIEVGDVSPSGTACTQSRALGMGHRRGHPDIPESSLPHPDPWSQASWQSFWVRDGRPVLVPPSSLVKSTSASAGTKSCLPPSGTLGKSEDMAVAGPVDTPPPGSMGIRVWSPRSIPPISTHQAAKSTTSKVSDDPFLLIPGQSQDYPVEIASSRETSSADSTASSWINLDSGSSKQGGSRSNGNLVEALSREATVLQSHLLWLTDLLVSLTQQMDQPTAFSTIQPIMTKVLEHQKWVQALLTDTLTTLATNSILVQRDLTFGTLGGHWSGPKRCTEVSQNFATSGRPNVSHLH